MPQLLPDKITPLSYPSLRDALRDAEPTLRPESRLLLLGQIAFETALRSCHCNNLGNAKSLPSDTCDATMFPCGEELTATQAERWKAEHPELVTFKGGPYLRGGVSMQSVWVVPPHPATRFRAYPSLGAGVSGYLRLLKAERYRKAWAAVESVELEAFVRELSAAGYYNGGVERYLNGVRKRVAEARGALGGYKTLRFAGKDDPQSLATWAGAMGTNAGLRAATRAWQKDHGIDADGIVGNETWGTYFASIGAEAAA